MREEEKKREGRGEYLQMFKNSEHVGESSVPATQVEVGGRREISEAFDE